jgi:hypothetical protein
MFANTKNEDALNARVPEVLHRNKKLLQEIGDKSAHLSFGMYNADFIKRMGLTKLNNAAEKLLIHIEKMEQMIRDHEYYNSDMTDDEN